MSIERRIEKLEQQASPKTPVETVLVLPCDEPPYVAVVRRAGQPDQYLTQAEYEKHCAASPNAVVIRPRADDAD